MPSGSDSSALVAVALDSRRMWPRSPSPTPTARLAAEPLLFTGHDFRHTDIPSVLG